MKHTPENTKVDASVNAKPAYEKPVLTNLSVDETAGGAEIDSASSGS